MRRNRYGEWQGGPDPLAPPYDVRAAVDSVGRDVLRGGSLRDALRNLLRRGPDGRRGLDDLLARARRMRREAMRRGQLDGAVTRAQQLLDQAIAAERDELGRRDDDTARFNESILDNLPRSTARAIEELSEYQWASDEARALYQQILDQLRQEIVDQRFRGLTQALSDPGAQQAFAEMLHDLNALLDRHARGEDTTDQFAEFMQKHGDFFPEKPSNVDELIDALARRAAAGERLMRSLSAEQQAEFAGLMRQALGNGALAGEMAALGDNLRALRPDLNWGRGQRVRGGRDLGYGEAAGALEEIGDLDDLMDQLGQDLPGSTLDDIDVETGAAQPRPGGGRRRAAPAGARTGAASAGLGHPGRRRADVESQSIAAPWRDGAADRLRRPRPRPAWAARPTRCRRRGRGDRSVSGLGVRRRAAAGCGADRLPGCRAHRRGHAGTA